MSDDFLDAPGPALSRLAPATDPPRGVLLVLHGGTQQSTAPVDGRSASLRLMRGMRDAVAPALLDAGHAVWLLELAVRGWNDPRHPSPVPDARWALEQVRAAYGPDVPVVLLGHSMGGRTAVHVADDPSVRGVVGLAPWLGPDDPVGTLRGVHLVVAHGRRDRITSARLSRAHVERARPVAASVAFLPQGLAGHYLLYRPGRWRRLAEQRSLDLLERVQPG